MMKLTYNSELTELTIESTLFESFVNTTSVIVNIEGVNYTIVQGDVYDTNKADITVSLSEGVHSVIITKVTLTEILKDKGCIFIDDNLICEIIDAVKDSYDMQIQLDYFILKQSTCNDCNAMKSVYSRLINALNEYCGCH